MTYEDVEKKLFDVDTITTFDYDTYEEKVQVVKTPKTGEISTVSVLRKSGSSTKRHQ